jgi:predicted transcriptional regulator
MDSIIQSLIERRNRLGWSTKKLAEKSDVPYSAIVRMERGTGYWENYIKQIDSSLNKALKSLSTIEKEQKQTQLQFHTNK